MDGVWICRLCGRRLNGATPGQRCSADNGLLIPEETARRYPDDTLLGGTVGKRYDLFDVLGQGGSGAVYRGVQSPLGREVAVKVTRPSFDTGAINHRGRFLREAKLLARLSSPGIVRVFDYGEEDDGLLYMVLELVPGQTLAQLLDARGHLSPSVAVRLIGQILKALEEPHAQGLVHRDLKPANIIVVDDVELDGVKLIDFGVAKTQGLDDEVKTRAGLALGTPLYMAPEQLRWDGEIGPWTDQYAVGVVLYEMLCGTPPFAGDTQEVTTGHLDGRVRPFPDELGVPAALADVVWRALSKEPAERFPSVKAMRHAISGVPESARPAAVRARPTRGATRALHLTPENGIPLPDAGRDVAKPMTPAPTPLSAEPRPPTLALKDLPRPGVRNDPTLPPTLALDRAELAQMRPSLPGQLPPAELSRAPTPSLSGREPPGERASLSGRELRRTAELSRPPRLSFSEPPAPEQIPTVLHEARPREPVAAPRQEGETTALPLPPPPPPPEPGLSPALRWGAFAAAALLCASLAALAVRSYQRRQSADAAPVEAIQDAGPKAQKVTVE